MAGNRTGGLKAAATIKKLKGQDFYKNIGRLGGTRSTNGGFASNKVGKDGLTGRQRAAKVGTEGGRRSKRSKR